MLALLILAQIARIAATGCDPELQQHIYHPHRFLVLAPCVAVTGTILERRDEKDGDAHIRLKLDPEFRWMLNSRNRTVQREALVVEAICLTEPILQKSAILPCQGARKIDVPPVGSRVRVLGPYVLDQQPWPDHRWREIHPATSITAIP